ncbi:Uncharacterised protein [Vibrio cholerae]|nr:Uncharacterised protein [Vibrio cholerae]
MDEPQLHSSIAPQNSFSIVRKRFCFLYHQG